ncbi:polysaccharide biosynthesis protein [Amycolatopsis australiensis]|uniref:Membrane protein involved in the export of O-antigen and teichoic acid n=1 Tax=Amycolatopsis australiensis TaxID=546364 RepID=A0A1K1RBZ8_9PSEU|nr:polysaccharide biosynthesis protein [Amycolatopsis australiensis]SFW69762.1 Membrane protein involved in the export of O-antigen and teichoic acid [Amycolatopsis australiensis]
MSVATEGPARTGHRVAAILVSLALAGNNAASYVLSLVAARILAPGAFGELSSLLAVLVIGVVPAMGLQTVVALRVARSPAPQTGSLFALGLLTSGIVATAALTLSPLLVLLLHLGSLAPALLVTAALGPLTLLGLFHGLLQGGHRFATLAGLIGLEGLGKVGGSLAGLLVAGSPAGALAGAAIGSLAVAVAGWQVCGRPRPRWADRHGGEILHAAQAMLALVLLVNLDLVLARHALPAASAGEYALGAIVTKIAYWLPQAVGVLVLPRFAASAGRRRVLPVALAVCACLDAVVLLASVVLGPALLAVIGGSRYSGSTMPVWPFALAGSMLALVQILLYARLADGDRRVTVLMWAAVAVEAVLITTWLHGSATQVVTVAAGCAGGLAVAGAALELRARRE